MRQCSLSSQVNLARFGHTRPCVPVLSKELFVAKLKILLGFYSLVCFLCLYLFVWIRLLCSSM